MKPARKGCADPQAPQLPGFSLEVEALDLGADVRAIGLELLETESREPLKGKEAAAIFAAMFPALSANEVFVVDFFSHLDRVRTFCKNHDIHFREAAERCVVVSQPSEVQLQEMFQRFEMETFGIRASSSMPAADPELEKDLSRRGLDAYHKAFARYTCCAVCEPENGWVTLLSNTLTPTEVIRRVRAAIERFDVYVAQPQ